MQGVVWIDEQVQEVIGDDMYGFFDAWYRANVHVVGDRSRDVRAFCLWLVSTPVGQEALERIRDFPRQLSLKFPDDTKPWRKIESDGKTVYVNGEAFVFECPTCGGGV